MTARPNWRPLALPPYRLPREVPVDNAAWWERFKAYAAAICHENSRDPNAALTYLDESFTLHAYLDDKSFIPYVMEPAQFARSPEDVAIDVLRHWNDAPLPE